MIASNSGTRWCHRSEANFRILLVCPVAVWLLFSIFEINSSIAADNGVRVPAAVQGFTKALQHEGVERIYHIHLLPASRKAKPAPLVVPLHGGNGNDQKFNRDVMLGTLTAEADKRGVIWFFRTELTNTGVTAVPKF